MSQVPSPQLDRGVQRSIGALAEAAKEGYRWLRDFVPDAFSSTLREDAGLLASLVASLPRLSTDREVRLTDREHELTLLRLDVPGSVLKTLAEIEDRDIASTEIFHSDAAVPGTDRLLEVHHYELERPDRPAAPAAAELPRAVRKQVLDAAAAQHPERAPHQLEEALRILWVDNERWVRLAPPRDVAQLLGLFLDCRDRAGFALDLSEMERVGERVESQLLFAAASPPARGFLMQITEALDALNLGTRRLLALSVTDGGVRYFLASFHVAHREGAPLTRDGELFKRLRRQLCAAQILAVESPTYRDFVLPRIMTAEDAALVNAFIGFAHTNCAHNQSERYTFEDVVRAFHFHPEMSLALVRLFKTRFDPDLPDREKAWAAELAKVEHEVASYNTGHRILDEFRRSLFQVALVFVKRTLKTNFFVEEKQALAFRLDPAYLADLGPTFTADLPPERPFRVTFFYGRQGLGYHIGFADIARGGWRTILTRSRDDYVTVANRVFRENYVLAHTQHLKNKDIYEGGSKLVVVVNARGKGSREEDTRLFHKVQRAFANAFLDVFVTEGGKARDPRVVDYYGEDEPIELGPDENMHDEMIEEIAALSVRRGYLLGAGIMSSKKVGINHKEFGVTSTGVIAFAATAMKERGVDIRQDAFSVKLTGGPNGDVAGNALRLLLERCPKAEIRLIVDGTAALVDPRGLDREALGRVVLKADADAFDTTRLSPGGSIVYRNVRKADGLRELHRRVEMTAGGPKETWVTVDEFHQEYDHLLFRVKADLFIPAGGRPETIDKDNWRELLGPDGVPTAAVIVEGANSFVTPEARLRLQEAGVVVLRDASANKCGVISSSYEIIGNLLFSEREFLAHKADYVRDVLEILEKRAGDEAGLIFRRHREEGGKRPYTAISEALSVEINRHKAQLFRFFEANPEHWSRHPWREALLAHLPRMVRESPAWRLRVKRLPSKYRSAILAAEIATEMVYRGGFEPDFATTLHDYVGKSFG
ncbi:MAG TPA: NAD-glutamate dehydrogenase domain-containing protein [Anaeromyxobacteraceae bacterium]|nr:NAD-glutamate dehydrogenase domain-containing protein [Anaeromyxobacteraceae bacterium]